MGKHRRARRAAKATARTRTNARGGPAESGREQYDASATPLEQVQMLLRAAPQALLTGDDDLRDWAEAELCRHPAELVHMVAATELGRAVAGAWTAGWQPAELVRHARRTTAAAVAELIRTAIAADHLGRVGTALDQRWVDQVAGLELPAITGPEGRWIAAWAADAGLGVFSATEAMIGALRLLRWIPVLEELVPPPGGSSRPHPAPASRRSASSDAERAMLDKIRALLAKAESTTFEAEAEAFTAKAQELMTRHAIDAVTLDRGSRGAGDEPIAVRIAIDDPYVDAKTMLLHVVATAGRCRAVFLAELSAVSVVGYSPDVAGVEMLYTSLLVQAQTSLTNAARALPAGARQRSRSFRSSFLLAYAHRIGERLEAINAAVIAETESATGRSVLPALLSREVAVDESVADRYGNLESRRIRGGQDAAGWAGGRAAADRAKLVAGALPAT